MFSQSYLLNIWTITPTCVGGNAEINAPVDNPIARERYTQYPILPGSAIKGVLVKYCEDANILTQPQRDRLFGKTDNQGIIAITDASLIAFPVKSLKGLFGWVSSAFTLNRLNTLAPGSLFTEPIPEIPLGQIILPAGDRGTTLAINLDGGNKVNLEMFTFSPRNEDAIRNKLKSLLDSVPSSLRWLKDKLEKDWGVVANDAFKMLVTQCTEIQMRTRIGPQGTVEHGALWSEEYLPSYTWLAAFLHVLKGLKQEEQKIIDTFINTINGKYLQIGANETIGKGFVLLNCKQLQNLSTNADQTVKSAAKNDVKPGG